MHIKNKDDSNLNSCVITGNGSINLGRGGTQTGGWKVAIGADGTIKTDSTINGASVLIDNGDGTTLDVKERLGVLANLATRLSAIENADITDDAEHSALLTLVASLATRVTALEQGGN